MNKTEIEQALRDISDWRHPFQLDDGSWVRLHRDWYRSWHQWRVDTLMPTIKGLADHLVEGGFSAADVMDLGCWDGFYGYSFLRAGARSLLGVDLRAEALRRANLLKAYYGFERARFIQGNLQDPVFDQERPHISLLYGILYHLSTPIEVLRRVGQITGSMILVNSYAPRTPEPELRLLWEDPAKDSTGHQELVTTPTEGAIVEMLHYAGCDLILRHYPHPMHPRYADSSFGFIYGLKCPDPERQKAILETFQVRAAYRRGAKETQLVRLLPRSQQPPRGASFHMLERVVQRLRIWQGVG